MARADRQEQWDRPRARSAKTLKAIGTLGAALLVIAATQGPDATSGKSAAPVFTRDVAPVFYRNCTTCHRPGGIGPFSLLSYDTAKSRADDIHDAVSSGYMPPWHADGPHGVFRNDRRLSDEDKQTILKWIEGGTPKGDDKDLPAAPVYPSSWEMGTPDAIVNMPEDFTVPASGTIEYQYFEVPTNFTEDKWVQAVEVMPGARDVVHHVIVFARVPAPPRPANAAPPSAAPAAPAGPRPPPLFVNKPQFRIPEEPPRKDTLHPPPRALGNSIAGTVPGGNMFVFAPGTAMRIRAGTILTFQVHYTAHGHEMKDRTAVGFKFASGPPEEEIRMSSFLNGSFVLPAGAKDVQVPAELEPTQNIRIWGLLPHTHLRGTGWKYTLEKPDGTSEVILDVPRYDFNWQQTYFFATPLEVPAGSKLKSVATYDNSASNSHNPDPTKEVRWGDQTWEEMQFTGFFYSIPRRQAP